MRGFEPKDPHWVSPHEWGKKWALRYALWATVGMLAMALLVFVSHVRSFGRIDLVVVKVVGTMALFPLLAAGGGYLNGMLWAHIKNLSAKFPAPWGTRGQPVVGDIDAVEEEVANSQRGTLVVRGYRWIRARLRKISEGIDRMPEWNLLLINLGVIILMGFALVALLLAYGLQRPERYDLLELGPYISVGLWAALVLVSVAGFVVPMWRTGILRLQTLVLLTGLLVIFGWCGWLVVFGFLRGVHFAWSPGVLTISALYLVTLARKLFLVNWDPDSELMREAPVRAGLIALGVEIVLLVLWFIGLINFLSSDIA